MESADFKYIRDNFIETNAILNHFGLENTELENLIYEEIIPGPSYCIETQIKITSALNDEKIELLIEKYFAKSILPKIEGYLKEKFTSQKVKTDFKRDFKNSLINHRDKEFAYGNIFRDNALNEEEFNINFEEEWDFYIAGGYGICTLNATAGEIIEKEIAVKKIKKLYEDTLSRDLTKDQIEELIVLNNQFNKVAAYFAPYQRQGSSRGKYLDTLLRKENLDAEIKNYERHTNE